MIIVKGDSIMSKELGGVSPILFVKDGAYCYVESGIVENELRILGDWETVDCPLRGRKWLISWHQGTEIPQELGDYLVTHSSGQ